jgi:O-antigen ligase
MDIIKKNNRIDNLLNNNHFLISEVITFYILILFPVSFIIGSFAVDFLVILTVIFFLFICKKKKIFKEIFINYKNILICFLIFYFFSLISFINSQEMFKSFYKSFFHLRFFIFAIAVDYIFFKFYKKLYVLKKFYFFLFLIICLSGFFEYFNFFSDYFFNSKYNSRISGIFGSELILGSVVLKLFFINLGFFSLNKKETIYLFFLFVLTFFTIYISKERIVMLLFLSSIIIFSFYYFKPINKKYIFFILILISLFLYSVKNNSNWIKFINYVLVHSHISKFEKYVDTKNHPIDGYNYFKLFYTGYEIGKSYFPIGAGVRNFRNECIELVKNDQKKVFSCDTHPHNIYFEIIAETGFFGFVFFIFFLFYLIIFINKIHKNSKEDSILKGLSFSIIFIFFWPIATTGSFFNNYNSALIWFNIGFLFFLQKIRKEKLYNL